MPKNLPPKNLTLEYSVTKDRRLYSIKTSLELLPEEEFILMFGIVETTFRGYRYGRTLKDEMNSHTIIKYKRGERAIP